MPKQEDFLSAELAAKRLNVKARRMREIAAERQLERVPVTDPETGRPGIAYRAAAIEQVRKDMMEQVVQRYAPEAAASQKLTAAPAAALPGTPSGRPWLSVAEAAEYSGLLEKTLLRLIRDGSLAAINQHVPDDRWRIRRADLDALEGEIQT